MLNLPLGLTTSNSSGDQPICQCVAARNSLRLYLKMAGSPGFLIRSFQRQGGKILGNLWDRLPVRAGLQIRVKKYCSGKQNDEAIQNMELHKVT